MKPVLKLWFCRRPKRPGHRTDMNISKLWVLVIYAMNYACRVMSGDFPDEAARLLRAVQLPRSRRAVVPTIVEEVRFVLQSRFPGCKTELYGSIAAGVGLMASDIDVAVTLSRNDPAKNATQSQLVMAARDIVLQYPALFEVQKVATRELFPVLGIKHLPTGFEIDVSFDNIGVGFSKLINYLVSLDQRARDLVQIVKYWAKIQEVSGHNMLPSCGVVTMVIFYLQQREILPSIAFLQRNAEKNFIDGWNIGFVKEKYANKNNETLCSLLGGFYRYYTVFDYNNYMASTYMARPIEIELFNDVNTVPEEFEIYKKNVLLNITTPLNLKTPLIQDTLEHNRNIAEKITIYGDRKTIYDKKFQTVAENYQEGCSGFLEVILGSNMNLSNILR